LTESTFRQSALLDHTTVRTKYILWSYLLGVRWPGTCCRVISVTCHFALTVLGNG